jgi:hypothetical protein
MGLLTSGATKGEKPIMPAVREASPDEAPVALEKVEVSPGNFIKMSPADKAAYFTHQEAAERSRQSWQRVTAGIVDEPAAGASDADVLVKYLSRDELAAVAARLELATSGSKARLAERIVAGDSATAETDEADDDEPAAEDEPEAEPA